MGVVKSVKRVGRKLGGVLDDEDRAVLGVALAWAVGGGTAVFLSAACLAGAAGVAFVIFRALTGG